MKSLELTALVVFLWQVLLFSARSQTSCGRGWFGPKCQYKCRCSGDNCDEDGLCTGSAKCTGGWFGPACQYVDLAYGQAATIEVTDGDDETCVDAVTIKRIVISVNRVLSWFRCHFLITGVLNGLRFRLKREGAIIPCVSKENATVDNKTMDIYCHSNGPVNELVLYGIGAHYLCTVSISGGRNVALKQNATQSSTYSETSGNTSYQYWTFPAELAVDGNKNQYIYKGRSCAMTSYSKTSKGIWFLNFFSPHLVSIYVLYNRLGDPAVRMKGVVVESFNETGHLVFSYRDTAIYALQVYTFKHQAIPVARVKVSTSSNDNVLHICELEIFGDSLCQTGYFGRDCQKPCNCFDNKECFVSSGGCPSGCAVGYQGEECNTYCDPGRYGLLCENSCSPFCVTAGNGNRSCDHVTGDCLLGCEIGYQAPKCESVCNPVKYGPNCSLSCSATCATPSNVSDAVCDHVHGDCLHGCDSGFEGSNCSGLCKPNKYGKDCQGNCSRWCLPSNNSYNSLCNHITGVCFNGCAKGYNGTLCNSSVKPLDIHLPTEGPVWRDVPVTPANVTVEQEVPILRLLERFDVTPTDDPSNTMFILAMSTLAVLGALIAITVVSFCIKKDPHFPDEGKQ